LPLISYTIRTEHYFILNLNRHAFTGKLVASQEYTNIGHLTFTLLATSVSADVRHVSVYQPPGGESDFASTVDHDQLHHLIMEQLLCRREVSLRIS
jgi:hypothetical protein